jgi:hypothetical protein
MRAVVKRKKKKMCYLTGANIADVSLAKTLEKLVRLAVGVMMRMPQPVAWVGGPISSGPLTYAENRARMRAVVVSLKKEGVTVFNHLPFEKRAEQLLAEEFKKSVNGGRLPVQAQRELRDDFYVPIFTSGRVRILYLLPDWPFSLNALWQNKFAEEAGIPVIRVPEDFVVDCMEAAVK